MDAAASSGRTPNLLFLAATLIASESFATPIQPVEEASGLISRFVVQIPAGHTERVLPTLTDLLRAAPRSWSGDLVVAHSSDGGVIQRALEKHGVAAPNRIRLVRYPLVASAWARDRFVGARAPNGKTFLLHPPRARELRGDFRIPWALRKSHEQWRLASLPCYLEGGDLLVGNRVALVGPRSFHMAAERQGRPASDIATAIENAVGKRIVVIDVPRSSSPIQEDLEYHLDMAMALLSDDTVLLSDPVAGEAFAPATWMQTSDRQRRVAAVANRLLAIEQLLQARGLAVERIPALLLPNDSSVATYVNVLQETDGTQRVVYLPQYGLAALDHAAVERYHQLGYVVHPVRVDQLYQAGGSLRCLVNVVVRQRP